MSGVRARKKGEVEQTSSNEPLLKIFRKSLQPQSDWPDKDQFLDVIYWLRQVISIILGIIWGIIPLQGVIGIGLFCAMNAAIVYFYSSNYQMVDDEEFGGLWEIIKEGFMTSFALFMVCWIVVYSGIHFD